jgi:AcrR family transcriptional regulator
VAGPQRTTTITSGGRAPLARGARRVEAAATKAPFGANGDPQVTREVILDAAEVAVRRFGLRRTSMNDVAQTARLSRGSVYRYFPDRDALIQALLERMAQRFVAESESSVRRRRTLAGQVAEAAVFIRTHLDDAVLTFPEDAAFGALLATQIEGLLVQFNAFWQPYLAAAEARGEIRAGIDHRRAADWIVRVMVSFVLMPSTVIDLDDPKAVRAFVQEFIVDGLGPVA